MSDDPFAKFVIAAAKAHPTPTELPADPFAKFAIPSLHGKNLKGPEPEMTGWPAKLRDVVIGGFKGVGEFAADVGETAANAGMIPGVRPALFDPAMRHPAFTRAEEAMTATNTEQRIGKGLETAAEILIPGGAVGKAAVKAIPSLPRAAGKFEEVMGAARNMPVDISGPGNVALRIQELAERGGSMPKAVRDFLKRVTDPEKGEMNYEEARDFASNISRLSANEFGRLTPVVAREVAGMRVALNRAVADAAGKAGKGNEYAQAMNEYGRAMRLNKAVEEFWTGAKRMAPYATAVGAGTWLTKKVMDAFD